MLEKQRSPAPATPAHRGACYKAGSMLSSEARRLVLVFRTVHARSSRTRRFFSAALRKRLVRHPCYGEIDTVVVMLKCSAQQRRGSPPKM